MYFAHCYQLLLLLLWYYIVHYYYDCAGGAVTGQWTTLWIKPWWTTRQWWMKSTVTSPGQDRYALKICLLNPWPKSTFTLRPFLSETSPIIFLCKWNQLDQCGWSLRCGLGPCGRLPAASALLWSSCSFVCEQTIANTEAHVLLHDFLQSCMWTYNSRHWGMCFTRQLLAVLYVNIQ